MKESRRNSYTSFIFLIFFFIFPFITIPQVFNSYEFPKFIFLVIFSLVFGNVLLIQKLFQKRVSIKLSKLDIAVLFFLLSLFVANISGVSFLDSMIGNAYRLQGFVTYLALGYLYFIVRVLSSKLINGIFAKLLSLQLAALGGYLIAQFILVKYSTLDISLFQNRFHGTFGNPNFAGAYLSMLFGYVLFWKDEKSALYVLKPLILLAGGIAILLTDSRSAILATVILVICYFGMLLKNGRRWIILVGVLFVASAVSVIFLALQYSIFEKRISIWENREVIWKEGLTLFQQRPILGYGQENAVRIFPSNLHFSVDNMHNIFLEYALSAGVVGVLSYLTVVLLAMQKHNNSGRFLIVAFLITGFFNPLSISQLMLFWVVIGLGNNK